MTKVVHSSYYNDNEIAVGCSVNEDGDALVAVNGKAIGTVDGLLEFISKYQGQQKAKVNVRWAAIGGCLGPRGTKCLRPSMTVDIAEHHCLWMFQPTLRRPAS